ncbi:Holliday junction resolvase RuvX [Rugosimonospora acidiphila]|uniref:Putative pre-16S rRNA nuclease n=1 Tax=Rugosimonospora acidiphila TaxID=556531 RepID=A0ABP9SW69_9ACTN
MARSDPDGILASPLVTLARDLTTGDRPPTGGRSTPAAAAATPPAPTAPAPALSAPGSAPSVPAGVPTLPTDIAELASLVREHEVVEVVVGLPITLAGREALAAAEVRRYAQALGCAIQPVPVRLSDERMTTVVASRRLSERGVRGRRQRAVVDQVAAVEILQGWLDNQRRRR